LDSLALAKHSENPGDKADAQADRKQANTHGQDYPDVCFYALQDRLQHCGCDRGVGSHKERGANRDKGCTHVKFLLQKYFSAHETPEIKDKRTLKAVLR